MGQKTNPIIFQLTKTHNWKSKYIEKRTSDFSVYGKQDLEIKNFIIKFFKNDKIKLFNMVVNDFRFYYLNRSIHIFVSYDQSQTIFKLKTLLKTIKKSLKVWKKELFLSLIHFTKRKYKLFIILERLDIYVKQIILNRKMRQLWKKDLLSLRRYNLPSDLLKTRHNFFKKGVNILFNCVTNKKCSKLLGHFIITQLKILGKFKRHHFFLNFIKDALKLFKQGSYSEFKGIKIKIKGRLNGRSRSKNRTIRIANNISVIKIDSVIDYSDQTAFTSNGTLGVKIWIHEI